MEKLALSTNKLEKSVSEILLHQDQMIKLSQNCLKLEEIRPHSMVYYLIILQTYFKISGTKSNEKWKNWH